MLTPPNPSRLSSHSCSHCVTRHVRRRSYTAAFWGWARWKEEIDWMAMQGVNLPVAPVGQEAIFRKVYLSMGLSETDIEACFLHRIVFLFISQPR